MSRGRLQRLGSTSPISVKRSGAEADHRPDASAGKRRCSHPCAPDRAGGSPRWSITASGTRAEFPRRHGRRLQSIPGAQPPGMRAPLIRAFYGGQPFSHTDFVEALTRNAYGAFPDEDAAIPFAVCQAFESDHRGSARPKQRRHGRMALCTHQRRSGAHHSGPASPGNERGLCPATSPFLMAQWERRRSWQFGLFRQTSFETSPLNHPSGLLSQPESWPPFGPGLLNRGDASCLKSKDFRSISAA